MTRVRILVALIVIAVAAVAGWQVHGSARSSTIVVRYAEPPARGPGRLGLISCGLRIEDATGKVLARRQIPASLQGGVVRTVRIEMPRRELAKAKRVLANCTDAAGRTGEAATYALGPVRERRTLMAEQSPL
jgi:hypothetical protein